MDNRNGDPTSSKTAFTRRRAFFLALAETGRVRYLSAGTALHARSRTQVECKAPII